MRKIVLWGAFVAGLFVLATIQVSLLGGLGPFVASANSLLIFSFALFLNGHRRPAAGSAFFGGLFLDILSLRPAGTTSLLILFSLLVFSLVRRVIVRSTGAEIFTFFLLVVTYHLVWLRVPLGIEPILYSLFDLLLLFLFVLFVRLTAGVLNPPSAIQLRFKEIR